MWTYEVTQVFIKIKDLISSQAQLFFADDDGLVYLLTDASDYGVGEYLHHSVDGKELSIAFVSKSLSGAQLRWSSIQTHLFYLLHDRKFYLNTDHENLTFIGDSVIAMVVR